MKYYIHDQTLGKTFTFKSVPEVVKHLEGSVQRKFNLNRKQYMQNLIDLGYGYDDDGGITFTQSMAEHFSMGIVDKHNRYVRTNIHEAGRNKRYNTEYGD